MPPPVRTETDGPVSTILISRPEKRNAVDGPMAEALREAFLRFEKDDSQRVAVLHGEGGVFCAGADLAAILDPARRHELDMQGGGAGPMGPTRLMLCKPVIAAVRATPSPAGWSSPCSPTCAWSRRARRSASSAGAGACR